jgi:hypothetical protein
MDRPVVRTFWEAAAVLRLEGEEGMDWPLRGSLSEADRRAVLSKCRRRRFTSTYTGMAAHYEDAGSGVEVFHG